MTPAFTSHNVVFPDGSMTAPARPIVAESGVCKAALRYLENQFGLHHASVSVGDLGCLEGGYAVEFARAGYEVTGIEARLENYSRAGVLPTLLDLPNLRFLCADVRDLPPEPTFDAVFCSGLLYHLDKPVEFLYLLGKITKKLLILNTHFSAGPVGHSEHLHQPGERCEYDGSENEGMAGHWFYETENRWASYGNPRSFWLTKPGLTGTLREAGFGRVEEMTDWHNGNAMAFGSGGETGDRGMFVAVKP